MHKKILIVDDLEGVRREIAFLLEDEGHQVSQAGNGVEAIKQIEMQPPDLVITDVLMPEMDGLELCQFIRSNFPEIKIIVISGGGQAYIENKQNTGDLLRQVGKISKPDAILMKPFKNELLLKQIDDLFEGHEQ